MCVGRTITPVQIRDTVQNSLLLTLDKVRQGSKLILEGCLSILWCLSYVPTTCTSYMTGFDPESDLRA